MRQNAPIMDIEEVKRDKNCKKKCILRFSTEHLLKLRKYFDSLVSLVYDEQNLYMSGLIVKRETKRTVGQKRKSNPSIQNGKKVGRPPAEVSICSLVYQIRNEKGINEKVCQKAFLWIFGFGKRLEFFLKKIWPKFNFA